MLVPLLSQPGVKRDGTTFDSEHYVDALWCRFAPKPQKMGGYRSVNKFLNGLPRALNEFTKDSRTYIHAGSASMVESLTIDGALNTSIISDRTPTSGFTSDADNVWQFTIDHSATGTPQIIAQVAPNLDCICNSDGGELFIGDLTGTSALTAVSSLPGTYSATGGVIAMHPYTVVFGSDGFVMWSVPGDPSDYIGSGAGYAYVTRQKIVQALPLRSASGTSPSCLMWSADSLINMSYNGVPGFPTWDFSTISTNVSVMSPRSIVEFDGSYYWAGSDRFMMYNGVVREMPNPLNSDWFFNNLNYAQRQKTFAFVLPRYGEIWWCYPHGDSTEPDRAVIFNVYLNTWYDTALPTGGRGAGIFPQVFRKPILTGVTPQDYRLKSVSINAAGTGYSAGDVLTVSGGNATVAAEITVTSVGGSGEITAVSISKAGTYASTPSNPVSVTGGGGSSATFNLTFVQPYKLWVHETGVDEVDGQETRPVRSYFETANVSGLRAQTGKQSRIEHIIPDFRQAGDMSVTVKGRANARGAELASTPVTFPAVATDSSDELVRIKTQRGELRFLFESDAVGGDYEAGMPVAEVIPGDGRQA